MSKQLLATTPDPAGSCKQNQKREALGQRLLLLIMKCMHLLIPD